MRHRVKGKILGRERASRQALMVGLARGVFLHGRVDTTLAKAKAVKPFVERLVTLAKNPSLTNRRQLLRRLPDATLVEKMLTVVGPKFTTRPGGYTRIIKLGTRLGDGASRARLELVA